MFVIRSIRVLFILTTDDSDYTNETCLFIVRSIRVHFFTTDDSDYTDETRANAL